MSGVNRFVSVAEANKHNRELKIAQQEKEGLQDQEQKARFEEQNQLLAESDPSGALVARYEAKKLSDIRTWLSANVLASEFPMLSVQLHAKLQTYEVLIRELTPEETHKDGGKRSD